MTRYIIMLVVALGCIGASLTSTAGIITGGALLTDSDAGQLESWLGVNDQDFNMIWSGEAGVATASSFHASVDGAGPTFSIYEITLHDDSHIRIGGYTSKSWGGSYGYIQDSSAFIFNLDTLEIQQLENPNTYEAIWRSPDSFSAFGSGADIYAGEVTLGRTYTGRITADSTGSSYSWTYDQSQGQITIEGDSGSRSGNSGIDYRAWSVNSLEVYTFSEAVPEPASIVLLGISAGGILFMRRLFFFVP